MRTRPNKLYETDNNKRQKARAELEEMAKQLPEIKQDVLFADDVDDPNQATRSRAIRKMLQLLDNDGTDPVILLDRLRNADMQAKKTAEGSLDENHSAYQKLLDINLNYAHKHFRFLGQALGYPLDDKGICYGFAAMWNQASLTGKGGIQEFIRRLDVLALISPEEVLDKVESAERKLIDRKRKIIHAIDLYLSNDESNQEKGRKFFEDLVKKYPNTLTNIGAILYKTDANPKALAKEIALETLTEEQRVLTEVKAFYEGLQIYHRPLNQFAEIFSGDSYPFGPDVDHSMPHVASRELEKMGGAETSGSFSNIFTQESLAEMLKMIQDEVESDEGFKKGKYAVSLMMNGHAGIFHASHAVSLTLIYNSTTQSTEWYYFDSNRLPPTAKNAVGASEQIFDSFSMQKLLPLSASIYTRHKYASNLRESIEELQSQDKWNDLIVSSTDNPDDLHFLLVCANRAHDIKSVEKLLELPPEKLGVSDQKILQKYISSALNSPDILQLYINYLKKHEISFLPPSFFAQTGIRNTEIIQKLIDPFNGISLGNPANGRNVWGNYLATEAAKCGYTEICEKLLKGGYFPTEFVAASDQDRFPDALDKQTVIKLSTGLNTAEAKNLEENPNKIFNLPLPNTLSKSRAGFFHKTESPDQLEKPDVAQKKPTPN